MNFVDGVAPNGADVKEYQPDLFDEPSIKSQNRKARKAAKAVKKQGRQENQRQKPLVPLNDRQVALFNAFDFSDQIFAIGEAGTGKTYVLARLALRKLITGEFEKLYIARPTVSSPRHRQGFLPGNLKAKLHPWLVPILSSFKDEASSSLINRFMDEGRIEFLSFEHMRGRSLANSIVILDEAQNCTLSDLKLFLTRKGENSMFLVNGDPTQIDIDDSGLDTVLEMIDVYDMSPSVVYFEADDVVRSESAKEWVKAFKQHTDRREAGYAF